MAIKMHTRNILYIYRERKVCKCAYESAYSFLATHTMLNMGLGYVQWPNKMKIDLMGKALSTNATFLWNWKKLPF